jgi:DNA-binding HxlR family transcriptional regulator
MRLTPGREALQASSASAARITSARTVFPVVPPHVEYDLTALGRSLLGLVSGLEAWAEEHIADVAAARDTYDTRAATG